MDMNHLFNNCTSLITLPDISKWKTSKVMNMNYMFYSCVNLIKLPDISKWDVSNVINFEDFLHIAGHYQKFRTFLNGTSAMLRN